MSDEPIVRISVNLPKATHEKLKALAAKEHRNNNSTIINAIEEPHESVFAKAPS